MDKERTQKVEKAIQLFLSGEMQKDIGKELGVTPQAVAQWISRARKMGVEIPFAERHLIDWESVKKNINSQK